MGDAKVGGLYVEVLVADAGRDTVGGLYTEVLFVPSIRDGTYQTDWVGWGRRL